VKSAIHFILILSTIFSQNFAWATETPTIQTHFHVDRSEVQDNDPILIKKQKVVVENTNNAMIRFKWCEAKQDGSLDCSLYLGCRESTPYTFSELVDQRWALKKTGYEIGALDIGILVAIVAGGYWVLSAAGAAGAPAAGAVAAGEALPAGTILGSDGSILVLGKSAPPIIGAFVSKVAQVGVVTNWLTTLRNFAGLSVIGGSLTGLLVSLTKPLDPRVRFNEAAVLEDELWQGHQNDHWNLQTYRTLLHKALCRIDGFHEHD